MCWNTCYDLLDDWDFYFSLLRFGVTARRSAVAGTAGRCVNCTCGAGGGGCATGCAARCIRRRRCGRFSQFQFFQSLQQSIQTRRFFDATKFLIKRFHLDEQFLHIYNFIANQALQEDA